MSKPLDLSKSSDMRKFMKKIEQLPNDIFMDVMQNDGIETPCPLCGATIRATFGKVICPYCGGEIMFNPPTR